MKKELTATSYERHDIVEPIESKAKAESSAPDRPVIRAEGIVRFLVWLAIIALVGLLLWYFGRLVTYLIVGFLISRLTSPLVDRLQGLGIARTPAILLTFLVIFAVISVLIVPLIPFFTSQISEITQQITLENVMSWTAALENNLRERIPIVQEGSLIESVREISSTLFQEPNVARLVSSAVGVFTDIFYAVLVIPFVTFFFLRDARKIRRHALRFVPNRYFEVTLSVIEKIETNIGRYLRGLMLQCLYVAIVATIFLSFTDLNYALIVGIFTGIANSIPYFGPFMGLIAGSLVAVAQTGDFTLIPGLLIAMGLTQALDNVFFQPLIFSKAAQKHPLVIMFAVLMGAQAAGIVGMLVAIPITTTAWVAIEQILWSARNYRIVRVAR